VGGVRVERLAEAVTIVSRLLEGGPVTFAGRHYQVREHAVHPRPVQRPRPPLMIGGNGPRLLALAAAAADIVSLSGITFRRGGTEPDLAAWKAGGVDARVGQLRADAGERWPALELGALVQRVIVTDDRRGAAAELARRWPQLSVDDLLEAPFVLLGTVDQIAEDLVARRERWGLSYYVVFEPAMEAVAPVVARLAGR
jgi:probable F420-dependent oxidoreductase